MSKKKEILVYGLISRNWDSINIGKISHKKKYNVIMKIIKLSSLIKLAISFNDAMKKYKLTDPFIAFFVATYDKDIPWNAIKNENDLKALVSNTLMPELLSRLDLNSENGWYLKDLDPAFVKKMYDIIYPDDEEIMATKPLYEKEPEAGKKQLLTILNDRKKAIFDEWVNELNKEPYKSSPALQYLMLRPVMEKYPADDRRAGYGFSEKALEATYNKIKDVGEKAVESAKTKNKAVINPFKISKTYGNEYSKLKQEKIEENKDPNWFPDEEDPNKGWLFIPAQVTDPVNFDENQQKLYDYSLAPGHTWCTTPTGPGKNYLKTANFWLYLNNGYAEVAVKETPNSGPNGESKINEYRDPKQQNPEPYWEPITNLFEEKGWDKGWTRQNLMQDRDYPMAKRYTDLENFKKASKEFDEDPQVRQQILDEVRNGEIEALDKVANDSKKAPDVRDALEAGYLIALEDDRKAKKLYRVIDKRFLQNPQILKLVVKQWLAELKRNPRMLASEMVPSHIKKNPEFNKVLVQTIIDLLADNVSVDILKNLPPKWNKNKALKNSVVEGITNGFETNAKKFEELWKKDLDVFKGLKADEGTLNKIMESRVRGWAGVIEKNPMICEKADFPEDIKGLDGVKEARIEGWSGVLKNHPERFDEPNFPAEFKGEQLITDARLEGWEETIKGFPEQFDHDTFPEEMKGLKVIIDARLEGWGRRVTTNYKSYLAETFPADLIENKYIKTKVRDAVAAQIEKAPNAEIPPIAAELFPNDKTIQTAVRTNILKKLSEGYRVAIKPGVFGRGRRDFVMPANLQNDDEVITMQQGSLMRVFAKNPFEKFGKRGDEFNATFYPERFHGHPAIRDAKAQGIAFNTLKRPAYYEENKNQIEAENLLDHPEVVKGTARGWINTLNKSPVCTFDILDVSEDHFINTFLTNDPNDEYNFLKAVSEHLSSFILKNVSDYLVSQDFYTKFSKMPLRVKKDKIVIKSYAKALKALLRVNPWVYTTTFPANFKTDDPKNQQFLTALKEGVIAYFGQVATAHLISDEFKKITSKLPPSVLGDEDVRVAYKAALGNLVASDPTTYELLSEGLQGQDEIQRGLMEAKTKLVADYQEQLKVDPTPDAVRNSIMQDVRIPHFMKLEILNELGIAGAGAEAGVPNVIASRPVWYKKAKKREVIEIKSWNELIN